MCLDLRYRIWQLNIFGLSMRKGRPATWWKYPMCQSISTAGVLTSRPSAGAVWGGRQSVSLRVPHLVTCGLSKLFTAPELRFLLLWNEDNSGWGAGVKVRHNKTQNLRSAQGKCEFHLLLPSQSDGLYPTPCQLRIPLCLPVNVMNIDNSL